MPLPNFRKLTQVREPLHQARLSSKSLLPNGQSVSPPLYLPPRLIQTFLAADRIFRSMTLSRANSLRPVRRSILRLSMRRARLPMPGNERALPTSLGQDYIVLQDIRVFRKRSKGCLPIRPAQVLVPLQEQSQGLILQSHRAASTDVR